MFDAHVYRISEFKSNSAGCGRCSSVIKFICLREFTYPTHFVLLTRSFSGKNPFSTCTAIRQQASTIITALNVSYSQKHKIITFCRAQPISQHIHICVWVCKSLLMHVLALCVFQLTFENVFQFPFLQPILRLGFLLKSIFVVHGNIVDVIEKTK